MERAGTTVWLFVLSLLAAPAWAQTVRYVDDDAPLGGDGLAWNTAYRYLQDATFEEADPAVAEIRVAGGVYKPDLDEAGHVEPGDREATFQLISRVAVYGGYRGCPGGDCLSGDPDERDIELYHTILSGDLEGDDGPAYLDEIAACYSGMSIPYEPGCAEFDLDDDGDVDRDDVEQFLEVMHYVENSYQVVTASEVDTTAVLDGFTITAGCADYYSGYNRGGGVYSDRGDPTLTRCTFIGNYARTDGGGMYTTQASPWLGDCTFSGNFARGSGGGIYGGASSPTLANCSFTDNAATNYGGGIRAKSSDYGEGDLALINCDFARNTAGTGGGALLGGGGYADGKTTLAGCSFTGNSAKGSGGGIYNSTTTTLTSCLFSGNTANKGGGMYNSDAPWLTNCTFSGNSAGDTGGGIYNSSTGDPHLTNCILWGDSPQDVDGHASSEPVVSHCDIQLAEGVWEGDCNFNADPLFERAPDPGPDGTWGTADDDYGDLRPQAGSPCIDADDNEADTDGSRLGVQLIPGVDLDLNVRRVDDPDTDDCQHCPDPGADCGTAPTVDVGAYEFGSTPIPTHLFVHGDVSGGAETGTSWADAFPELQIALSTARAAGGAVTDIWVAAAVGPYRPDWGSADRTATFRLANGVAVYGGLAGVEDPATFDLDDRDFEANQTVLSGDLAGDDGPARLDEFVACYSGSGIPYEPGCEAFDLDGDDDVDHYDLDEFLVTANYDENSYHLVTGSWRNATAVLDGFTITAGNADASPTDDRRGAGMFIDGGAPTVGHCRLIGNAASYEGGAMWNRLASPTLVGCEFVGNITPSGGALGNEGSSPVLTDCRFETNVASNDGGAIWNDIYSSVPSNGTFRRCAFVGNLSGGDGGTFRNYNSSASFYDCDFEYNKAPQTAGGGALYSSGDGALTFEDCSFVGNVAGYQEPGGVHNCGYGGAMAIYNDVAAYRCEFVANHTVCPWMGSGSGGAVIGSGIAEFVQCVFEGNHTHIDEDPYASGSGGAINWGGPFLTLRNCAFTDNSAVSGGAIDFGLLSGQQLSAFDCTFHNNQAPNGSGGAISNRLNELTLADCVFTDIAADGSGGAVFTQGAESPGTVTNCVFVGNTGGSNNGGAVHAFGHQPLTVSNCLFVSNEAHAKYGSGQGGALSVTSADQAIVQNCTFFDNHLIDEAGVGYGGGVGFYATSGRTCEATIENCILWDNSPSEIGFHCSSYSALTLTVSCSDVQDGIDGVHANWDYCGDDDELIWSGDNINEDPLFVSGPDFCGVTVPYGGYFLSQVAAGQDVNSPCVDPGCGGSPEQYGVDRLTTRTDLFCDVAPTDMGYHYSPRFEGTGVLIQGTECVLFEADAGCRLWLEDFGGFGIGDRVYVTGRLERCDDGSYCTQADGVIVDGTITGDPTGDLNCDGVVNGFDIDPFVLALTSAPDFEAYYAAYPDCDAMHADINGDGEVNGFDIDPFVDLLTGG